MFDKKIVIEYMIDTATFHVTKASHDMITHTEVNFKTLFFVSDVKCPT